LAGLEPTSRETKTFPDQFELSGEHVLLLEECWRRTSWVLGGKREMSATMPKLLRAWAALQSFSKWGGAGR